MPTTPLVLYDNYCDTVRLYPQAQIDASEESDGFEAFRVADYRRERTYWQAATDRIAAGADHYIRVNHGATVGAKQVDYLVIDRDSTIEGMDVYLEGSADGVVWSVSQVLHVPAGNVVGGDPVFPNMARTEEGVAWGIAPAALAARMWWRLRVPRTAAFRPVITGLMFGMKTQLLGYSKTFDEDAGERTQATEVSTAGYRAQARSYSWHTCQLGLGTIGSVEYDATIRAMKSALFDRQAPWMLFMDYVTKSERGWLYELEGTTWNAPKTRVLRDLAIRGREVGHRIL